MIPIKRKLAFDSAKELVTIMNGLSEDGFSDRYLCDPCFHKGVDVIAQLYLQHEMCTDSPGVIISGTCDARLHAEIVKSQNERGFGLINRMSEFGSGPSRSQQ